MTQQVRLRPSNLERSFKCLGSLDLIKTLPPTYSQGGGPFAQEGTTAHAIGEKWLLQGRTALNLYHGKNINVDGNGFIHIDNDDGFSFDEMLPAVSVYVERVQALKKHYKAQLFVEQEINIGYLNDYKGQADAMLVSKEKGVVYIIDYKHGAGVPTNAVIQGQAYLIGAMHLYPEIDSFVWQVVQPRVKERTGRTMTQARHYTREELGHLEAEHSLKASAIMSQMMKLPVRVGEHCWRCFCPAKAICPSVMTLLDEIAGAQDMDQYIKDNLAKLIRMAPVVKSAIKQAEDMAYQLNKSGELPDTLKSVPKRRGNPRYVDAAVVEQFALEHLPPSKLYDKKLIGPSRLRGELEASGAGDNVLSVFDDYVERPPAGQQIVAREPDDFGTSEGGERIPTTTLSSEETEKLAELLTDAVTGKLPDLSIL